MTQSTIVDRDYVRSALESRGICQDTITPEQIKKLRRILNARLKQSGIFNGTAKLTPLQKTDGFYTITMRTDQWPARDAISFEDGFVRIADWADSVNAAPILESLLEWADRIYPVSMDIPKHHGTADLNLIDELEQRCVAVMEENLRLKKMLANATSPIRFPVALRKMWSGSEVQAWIDDYQKTLLTNAINYKDA